MLQYQSLNPNAKPLMRITAAITMIIITGILFFIRRLLLNIKVLEIFPVEVFDVLFLFIVINMILNITIYPQIRYNRWKYAINEDRVEIVKGLFNITREIIPIRRIQKIQIARGPLDRRFKLANVNILTAAGAAEIKFLQVEEAESISGQLEKLLKKKLTDEPTVKGEEGNEQ